MLQSLIPIAIFVPYAQQFNFQLTKFANKYWYTDVWLIQEINELQLLFVTTFWDAVSKFMVAMSIARWLYAITKLLQVAPFSPILAPIRRAHSLVASRSGTGQLCQPSWETRLENCRKARAVSLGPASF